MSSITLSFKNTKVKTEERTRGRMKITIKLSKDEAEGFKNFLSIIKPDNVDEESVFKHLFFAGCKSVERDLMEELEKKKAELELQKQKELQAQQEQQNNDGN